MTNFTPTSRSIKVRIDGVDVTSYIMTSGSPGSVPSRITIDNVLASRIDQCKLGIYPADALGLSVWQTIAITNDAETETYFGGFVTRLDFSPLTDAAGNRTLAAAVDCQDHTVLLEKSIINLDSYHFSYHIATVYTMTI